MINRRIVLLLLIPLIALSCRSTRSLLTKDDPALRSQDNRVAANSASGSLFGKPSSSVMKAKTTETEEAETKLQKSRGEIVPVSSSDEATGEHVARDPVGRTPRPSVAIRTDEASVLQLGSDSSGTSPTVEANGATGEPVQLNTVVQSIYATYPLLQIAFYGRNIAAGEQLSAEGAWDLKLKAETNNTPLGFYQTYRNGVGFEQPTLWGGEVFGGYKLGRGNFEPWYGNRETNDGGEFGAGIRIPLLQNRSIDERRATLWKTTYGVNAVEPFIQAQIIEFIRAGSYAYWDWVAAGLHLRISRELLALAEERDAQIEGQVKAGARPEALLIDNHRLILSRQVKLIEAERKLKSYAIKLSLFLRTPDRQPLVPPEDQLPTGFPPATAVTADKVPLDVAEALARRPELVELDFQHRMAQIDLQQAENLTLPELDASLWSAKDVGAETDKKGSKTPFQSEAGLSFSVPLQRRKALGKRMAVEGKLVQIATKRQFAENKIATEVQNAVVTIEAAYRSIDKAKESVKLNEQLERLETIKLDKGDSDLLLLNLREAATFDARVVEIEALLHYFESQADYRAALALDIAEFGLPDQDIE